jgi:D-alanyl-D-alanine carboxypeptidase/D-alanyl-D-alanine-endopeptidase (penicillin-binding protein 4)
MRKRITFSAIPLLFALLFTACAKRPPETGFVRVPQDPVQQLRMELRRVLEDPVFDPALWGVAIQSLENGEMLYHQNFGKLLMPASNMKLITAAASLKKLGADFRYETQIRTDGELVEGTLTGNVVIVGSGDPTISGRFGEGNHFRVLQDWALQLREMGIMKVAGNIIGIDDAFDDKRIGYGWSWDDLPYYYATEVDALQFAENSITVTIYADQADEGITVKKEPNTSYVTVVTDIRIEPGAEVRVDWHYEPETKTVFAVGVLPPGGQDYGSFSIHNPAAYFSSAFKEALQQNGIEVAGEAYRGADRSYILPESSRLLIHHWSPPLSEIISVVLKVSQNLYAETLLKTLGKGTSLGGVREVEKILAQMEIKPENFIIADGSGLSRYNYITPAGLLQLLQKMSRDPAFGTFYNALAIAGVDGTLRLRMKGTSAENNVRAKTGSLSNVRALSGYALTRDGELMAFVLMANNFNVSNETVQHAQDTIVQQITNFTRK